MIVLKDVRFIEIVFFFNINYFHSDVFEVYVVLRVLSGSERHSCVVAKVTVKSQWQRSFDGDCVFTLALI